MLPVSLVCLVDLFISLLQSCLYVFHSTNKMDGWINGTRQGVVGRAEADSVPHFFSDGEVHLHFTKILVGQALSTH